MMMRAVAATGNKGVTKFLLPNTRPATLAMTAAYQYEYQALLARRADRVYRATKATLDDLEWPSTRRRARCQRWRARQASCSCSSALMREQIQSAFQRGDFSLPLSIRFAESGLMIMAAPTGAVLRMVHAKEEQRGKAKGAGNAKGGKGNKGKPIQ